MCYKRTNRVILPVNNSSNSRGYINKLKTYTNRHMKRNLAIRILRTHTKSTTGVYFPLKCTSVLFEINLYVNYATFFLCVSSFYTHLQLFWGIEIKSLYTETCALRIKFNENIQ